MRTMNRKLVTIGSFGLLLTACEFVFPLDSVKPLKAVGGGGGQAESGGAPVAGGGTAGTAGQESGGVVPGGAGGRGGGGAAGVAGQNQAGTAGLAGSGGNAPGGGGAGGADPCNPNPCAHGTCAVNGVAYSCSCALNYFGPKCETARIEAIPLTAAMGVNADGSVVVGFKQTSGMSDQFAAQWTALGGVQVLSTDNASEADAVSGDGVTVFGTEAAGTNAVRWANGQAYPLGLPTGASPGAYALARVWAANANGSVMVGYTIDSQNGLWQAFRWSTGAGFDVFGPAGTNATGVSGDGSVVVGDSNAANAFRWTVGTRTFQNLEYPAGYRNCSAASISSDGRVTIGACISSGGSTTIAVRWDGGTVYQLGALQSNTTSNFASAVNTDGSLILVNSTDDWLWDPINGARSVTSVLAGANGDVSGWAAINFTAMSSDGKTLVGSGTLVASGTQKALIARLP
jgi:hypothetical protein